MTHPSDERPRVLYIDDDAALGVLVRRALERRGFEVETVTDGGEGVARAVATPFDLVAVDHYMPGQDGLTTLEQLTRTTPETPVIYVTGSDESRIAVAALKAGARDYVVKSGAEDFFDLLASTMDQAIEQVRLKREKDRVQGALREANARLEAIVERQAVMMREMNHRIANSLQLVSSMVNMQAASLKDAGARTALKDTQTRLAAVIQIHRRLYTSEEVETVNAAEYLTGLVEDLQSSLAAADRPIRLHAEPVTLSTDRAVSLGVVVAELVTNACKYAYPEGAPGEVRVKLRRLEPGRVQLTVEDDGRGLSPVPEPLGTGLGRKVIDAMAQNLRSQLVFDDSHAGARAVLAFPA